MSSATLEDRLTSLWENPKTIHGWFATVDHKELGIRYLVTAFAFLIVGGFEALLMRIQLSRADMTFLSPEAYNQIFTMHGATMIFWYASPILSGFAVYLVPLMIGARDMAFPRLNAFTYWSYLFSGIFLYIAPVIGQAPHAGWFAYVPYTLTLYSPSLGMDIYALALIFLTGGAINFIITILRMRAPGMAAALPDAGRLKNVVRGVVREGSSKNGGLGNQEWAVVVNRDGIVCSIVFSGTTRSDQWPGSRVIAAAKANTANGLSGRDYALSTANIFAASQPGQSLYSLATSQPPNPSAVIGNPTIFGTPNDPMVAKAIGGIIVFGGGLALYTPDGRIVGGLGLSGDTSCTDHVIAWKVRHQLGLDAVPFGPSAEHNDNMILDWQNGNSPSGFGHPSCKGGRSRTLSSAISQRTFLLARRGDKSVNVPPRVHVTSVSAVDALRGVPTCPKLL